MLKKYMLLIVIICMLSVYLLAAVAMLSGLNDGRIQLVVRQIVK